MLANSLTSQDIGTKAPITERRCVLALLVVVLAVVLALPAVAHANVEPVDRVDGATYKELDIPRAAMPDVSMKAGALVTEDGRVLWSRRETDRRAMASITKLMTAVVAVENSEPKETVTIPADSARVGESTSFLRVGEKLPMSELLEALLIKSGNDAAYAVAVHVSGSEEAFVELMNRKADELGMSRTSFANSHGLDQKNHYSTAEDLAVLARYAMTKDEIRDVVGLKSANIGTGKRAEKVTNTNILINNYAGANGMKTGWTSDAGYCVIVSARRDGIELYSVVLGTRSELTRFRDAKDLLDFGFAHYRPQRLASAGTVIAEAPVAEYVDLTAPGAVSEDTTIPVFDLAGPLERTVAVAKVAAPIAIGQRVGVANFTQGGRLVASVPLVATAAVADPNPLQRIGIAFTRAWLWVRGE